MNLLCLSNLTGHSKNLEYEPIRSSIGVPFLVAQATKMTYHLTNTTLVLTCWTSQPFSMLGVTTFITSVMLCVLWIKSSLFLWLSCIFIMLVGSLPKLEGFIFLLAGWYPCALILQEINLYHLWVSGNLFDIFCCSLGTFHLFCKLAHCTGWKLASFNMFFIQCLGNK